MINGQGELEEFRDRWRHELHQRHDPGGAEERRTLPGAAPAIVDDAGCIDDDGRKRRKTEGDPPDRSGYDIGIVNENLKGFPNPERTSRTVGTAGGLLQGATGCLALVGKYGKSGRGIENAGIGFSNKHDSADKKREISAGLRKKNQSENLLDKLISDLDEINDIPFFDIELPRELAMKIFEVLDMKDLLSCAQVSTSWRSLADDDILWCRVCHQLGYYCDTPASEKKNWKNVVKNCLDEDTTLRANWKGRIGGLMTFEYVRGGILNAVQSYGDKIISGYSGGDVKLWDINSNDGDLLQTSHESVGFDPRNRPAVSHVALNGAVAMATYENDDVDIWSLAGTPMLVHHFTCRQNINCVAMAKEQAVIAAAEGHSVRIEATDENGHWNCKRQPSTDEPVTFMKFIPNNSSNLHIVMVTESAMGGVYYYPISAQSPDKVIKLHQMITPISCLDVGTNLIACGVGSTGFQEGFLVKILDFENGKVLNTLHGHNWGVTCVNLADSPTNMIITGCRDKKVRVYDTRSGEWPVMTVRGHGGSVTAVQMDDWKAVSGGFEGMLCVWDLRMKSKLWETYARHPVGYCHFNRTMLISAHIPQRYSQEDDDFDIVVHKRQRGDLRVYNFLIDQDTGLLPSICQSTYDEPEGYNYNITLAVPYDDI